MKTKIEISAIELAYNLYVKGFGLTYSVKMANDKITDLSKLMNPEQDINPSLLTNRRSLSYRVKKNGVTHYYSKSTAPDQILEIQYEHATGKSVSELAKMYGLSQTTIRSYLGLFV
jgi:DNA-binding NarL/FixJ family response regulator